MTKEQFEAAYKEAEKESKELHTRWCYENLEFLKSNPNTKDMLQDVEKVVGLYKAYVSGVISCVGTELYDKYIKGRTNKEVKAKSQKVQEARSIMQSLYFLSLRDPTPAHFFIHMSNLVAPFTRIEKLIFET